LFSAHSSYIGEGAISSNFVRFISFFHSDYHGFAFIPAHYSFEQLRSWNLAISTNSFAVVVDDLVRNISSGRAVILTYCRL
jgi:hypothetical protein